MFYKTTYGYPERYEIEKPAIQFPYDQAAILGNQEGYERKHVGYHGHNSYRKGCNKFVKAQALLLEQVQGLDRFPQLFLAPTLV